MTSVTSVTPTPRRLSLVSGQPKPPPHDHEAEQSVLGALMLDNRKHADVAGFLRAEDFYGRQHQLIYAAITRAAATGAAFDFVTVSADMRQNGTLDEAGGTAYLGQIANDTPSTSAARSYAEIVAERSARRAMIAGMSDAISGAYDGDDLPSLTAAVASSLDRIVTRSSPNATSFADALTQAEAEWTRANAENASGRSPGIPFGLPMLDHAIGGMRIGELWGLAARTSLGKTATAAQFAVHAALRGYPSLYVTLEETASDLAMRVVANVRSTNLASIRRGQADGLDAITDARTQNNLDRLPLWIDDRTFDLDAIRARITAYERTQRIKLAVVDHLTLVDARTPGRKRYEEIGAVTRALKVLAQQLRIAILILIQVSRASEQENRRPRLSDLRESGNIEQDLNGCIALHLDANDKNTPTIEIGLLKNRYGMKGWPKQARFQFRGEYQRIEQLCPSEHCP